MLDDEVALAHGTDEIRPTLEGKAQLVRYADDFVRLFEKQQDTERVQETLHQRMAEYELTLHPDKTVHPFPLGGHSPLPATARVRQPPGTTREAHLDLSVEHGEHNSLTEF
jgi:hypothetical protein